MAPADLLLRRAFVATHRRASDSSRLFRALATCPPPEPLRPPQKEFLAEPSIRSAEWPQPTFFSGARSSRPTGAQVTQVDYSGRWQLARRPSHSVRPKRNSLLSQA